MLVFDGGIRAYHCLSSLYIQSIWHNFARLSGLELGRGLPQLALPGFLFYCFLFIFGKVKSLIKTTYRAGKLQRWTLGAGGVTEIVDDWLVYCRGRWKKVLIEEVLEKRGYRRARISKRGCWIGRCWIRGWGCWKMRVLLSGWGVDWGCWLRVLIEGVGKRVLVEGVEKGVDWECWDAIHFYPLFHTPANQ